MQKYQDLRLQKLTKKINDEKLSSINFSQDFSFENHDNKIFHEVYISLIEAKKKTTLIKNKIKYIEL